MLYNKLFACRCKNGTAGIHHPQVRFKKGARWMPLEKAVEYGLLTVEHSADVLGDLVSYLDALTHSDWLYAPDAEPLPTVYYKYPQAEEEGGAENE